jgi:hypothetical protein
VTSSLQGIAGVPPSGERATSTSSEATPRLVVPRAVAPPQHVALSAPRLLEGSGCRGGVHSGARLDAMGGGEHGARGRFAKVRVGSQRW